ncbi:hypothetical protein SynBIOSE41_01573 [Synechococcus sp. BIOS-E4-1]|nr:hypothetical protein SynBIOSE41_01573 [Synechococcus sp. BIOS-E4-1]
MSHPNAFTLKLGRSSVPLSIYGCQLTDSSKVESQFHVAQLLSAMPMDVDELA